MIVAILLFLGLGALSAPAGAAGTPSTTTVADNASNAVTGGSFTFTATVAGSPGPPTGGIVWVVSDPHSNPVGCSTSTIVLDGSGKATCTLTNVIAGTYSAMANYVGDATYALSSGLDTNATVGKAPSATSVADNATGQSTGGTFTITATVTGPAGTPTGGIVWTVTDLGSNPVTCSTTTPLVSGHATCTVTNAIAGAYSATASYGGDGSYTSSSGSDSPHVAKAASTTVVTDNAPGKTTGATFTFGATVTGAGVTPSGSVIWSVTGPNSQPVSCPSSTLTGGVGACTIANALPGTYSATAVYAGDANYSGSLGQDPTAAVTKGTPPVGLTVLNATSHSPWNSSELTGAKAQATAGVIGGGGVIPTGTLTYNFYSNNACSAPAVSVPAPGPFPLNNGVVQLSNATGPLNAGSYSYQATYSGDTNYLSSKSACTAFTVAQNTAPSPPSISNIPGDGAAVYGGGYTPTVSTVTDGAGSVTSSTPTVCIASGLRVSFVDIGTCTLTAHTAGTPNYTASTGTPQSFSVGRGTPSSPTISNISSSATEFGTFLAAVSTTGDGTTSVASISTAVCTVAADGHTVTFVGFGVCTLTASVAQGPHYLAATGSTQSFPVGPAARGYWLVGSDGGIFSFGAAGFYGSMGSTPLQRPVVGITPSASRTGYWLVASDGGIFSFGTSSFYGSIPGVGLHPAGSGQPNSLNAPIVAMVPSTSGHGYFMIASDGGVFAFGDAHFAGSCPGIGGCSGKAVSVMPDSTGNGYWLVTDSGAVYAFGDATFYGSPPPTTVPVVDAVATPDWRGYWLLYANGVVDGFGDAISMGGALGYVNSFNPATSIFPTADGKGYWVAAARGDVFTYGDAPYLGGMAAAGLNGQIIAAFGF